MADAIMDEVVASCLICGQQRKLAIWHVSGSGVCEPCRYKATAEGGGYVLRKATHGALFKNRIYTNWTDAKAALDGMVWHNREGWEILPVMIGAAK